MTYLVTGAGNQAPSVSVPQLCPGRGWGRWLPPYQRSGSFVCLLVPFLMSLCFLTTFFLNKVCILQLFHL